MILVKSPFIYYTQNSNRKKKLNLMGEKSVAMNHGKIKIRTGKSSLLLVDIIGNALILLT